MVRDSRNDITANVVVIDGDTMRYGGSFFSRVSDEEREKRFVKLQEVAEGLYKAYWRNVFHTSPVRGYDKKDAEATATLRPFRDQLEALGVMINEEGLLR